MDGWVETLVGRIICPLVDSFESDLAWYWFSRYSWIVGVSGEDITHCEFSVIPAVAKRALPGHRWPLIRSLRFRFEITDLRRAAFESKLRQLLKKHGAFISDVREYDCVDDLGSDRFLGGRRHSRQQRIRRSKLIVEYLNILSRLFIAELGGPDARGRFSLARNKSRQNPNHSTFESVHHMLCNMLQPPLQAYFFQHPRTKRIFIGSAWSWPDEKMALMAKLPIRF
jgi:hypothetical protein